MFEALFTLLALGMNIGQHVELESRRIEIERAGCAFEVQQINSFEADQLWPLDYLDMLQSPKGPLLRSFVYIDYRQQGAGIKRPLAVLVMSQKLRAEDVNVFLISSVGKVRLSKIGIADENSGYDFRVNADFKQCGSSFGEELVFFEVSGDSVDIHHKNPSLQD